jgi:hypothetical protein
MPISVGNTFASILMGDLMFEASLRPIVVLGEDIFVVDIICRMQHAIETTLPVAADEGLRALTPILPTSLGDAIPLRPP